MAPKVSVLIPVKDVEDSIGKCIQSILAQSFTDFEIILIDDGSTDNTESIIKNFKDMRIKLFKNNQNLGIAKSRNKGLKNSTGEYIFFTDGDCVAAGNWIEEGLKCLENSDFVGLEGKIYYVSKNHENTFSDHVSENKGRNQFMTGNVAYKKSVLELIGGFDEHYGFFSDRDLGLRIKNIGKIGYNPDMIVYHKKVVMNPKLFLNRAKRMRNRVLLYKKFRDKERAKIPTRIWRIMYPLDLLTILFPPLILRFLFLYRFKKREDWVLFPYIWIKRIYERLILWKTCAIERVFLI